MTVQELRHGAASLLAVAKTHPRVAQELLRHAPGSRITMERSTHVTAGKQREAADALDMLLGADDLTVTDAVDGVVEGGTESPEAGLSRGKNGSGGRTRTYDQAVNSRPLYH